MSALSFGNELAQDPQLLADFVVESREHLANIEARVLELEHGGEAEALHSLFRSFHTMKGLAGFLDLGPIQQAAHDVENYLDEARSGRLQIDQPGLDAVLNGRDVLEGWVRHIETGGESAQPDNTSLAALLDALLGQPREAPPSAPLAPAPAAELAIPLDDPKAAAPAPVAEKAAAKSERAGMAANEATVVKVQTGKLEYLVDMVGELVIAQSLLRHDPELGGLRSPRLQSNLAQLTRVTGEVQKTAMSMRMVEVGTLFKKMIRLVRDLTRKNEKQAEVELIGEEVELDRSIVEELGDPLVHMIRNSVDHGLEDPAGRVAAGKPAVGKIQLKASHQAGQVVIEIVDDGRGLPAEKILAKARERGLIGPNERPEGAELFGLIFEPGFSTAEKVTEVSGRGVGMDVVRRHVEKLRGKIEVTSEAGKGATFRISVPLTLAIIDGLIVAVGGERFIVPIANVREMFRPAADVLFTMQGSNEMVLVREKLLPLVRLHRRFGVEPKHSEPSEALLVVGESESGLFCLMVDELLGKQEVVIKSLGPIFQEVKGVAGGAILGDGRVGLILEMNALARASG